MGSTVEYQLIEYELGQDVPIRVKRSDYYTDYREALDHIQPPLPSKPSLDDTKHYRLRRIEEGAPMRLGPRFTCILDLARIGQKGGHFRRRR